MDGGLLASLEVFVAQPHLQVNFFILLRPSETNGAAPNVPASLNSLEAGEELPLVPFPVPVNDSPPDRRRAGSFMDTRDLGLASGPTDGLRPE